MYGHTKRAHGSVFDVMGLLLAFLRDRSSSGGSVGGLDAAKFKKNLLAFVVEQRKDVPLLSEGSGSGRQPKGKKAEEQKVQQQEAERARAKAQLEKEICLIFYLIYARVQKLHKEAKKSQ